MFKKILAVVALVFHAAVAMAAIDVNKATEAELDSVKGIGPGTSKLILDERKKAPFKNWEDFIGRVKGVGEARAANLSEAGLTVGGKAYKPAAAAAKKDEKAAAKKDEKAVVKKDEKAAAKAEAKADGKAEKKEAKAAAAAPKAAASAAQK